MRPPLIIETQNQLFHSGKHSTFRQDLVLTSLHPTLNRRQQLLTTEIRSDPMQKPLLPAADSNSIVFVSCGGPEMSDLPQNSYSAFTHNHRSRWTLGAFTPFHAKNIFSSSHAILWPKSYHLTLYSARSIFLSPHQLKLGLPPSQLTGPLSQLLPELQIELDQDTYLNFSYASPSLFSVIQFARHHHRKK